MDASEGNGEAERGSGVRHLVDHRKLGRTASHRKALMRNLVTALILRERIETTMPKAKELRSLADRMIQWGKQGDLAARRQAARWIQSPQALHKLFDGLASRFRDRSGGYSRVIHFGERRGDGAAMAAIEYLGYELPKEKPEKKELEKKKEKKIEAQPPVKKQAEPARKPFEKKPEKKGHWWSPFRRKSP